MIDGRKNRKDFTSIVYETYKDFAENTSIHGLKYTVKTGIVIYEKVFWMIVVLAGLSGAGYMTVLFWNRYTSNPTRTSILTAYAPNTAVPFPAVTLCNINRIMADQVQDFISTLVMNENDADIVKRAFPQLLSMVSIDSRNYNMTELMVLHNVLLENNHNDIGIVMKAVTQSCKDMIIKCMWEFETVNCMDLFDETLTTDGHCCSFNYIREYKDASRNPIYTPFNGFNSGLKLHLDPEIQVEQYSSLHSSGLKVMVHSPWDYPGSGSIYKIVSAGRQSYLQVAASKIICSSDIKRLSIEQRQCAYSDEVKLKYFQLYSDTNCLTECEERYLYAKCGCVPFYYPFSTRRVCNITSIPCLDESIEFYDDAATMDQRHLREVFKHISLNPLIFDSVNDHRHSYKRREDQNVTKDSIALYIYFSGQRQTILYKDIITSTIYLLSSFGGVYSLFLGCSFITVVEIVYYCTLRLIVNLKLVGRIDKTAARNKREEPRQNQNQKLWSYEGSIFLN